MNNFDESMLDAPGQEQMRTLVSNLPEDSLSLAWRSQLNEKLLVSAKVARRRTWMNWVMKPALGVAVAGAFAMVVFVRSGSMSPVPVHATGSFEAALVQDHRYNVQVTDVAGSGLNPNEASPTSGYVADASDWSEVDLDSL